MNKCITCIICPRGCKLIQDEKTGIISGYSCLRGKKYGEQEFVLPKRSITSFIRTKNDKIICVKTDKPIDKKLIFDLMNILKEYHPDIDPKIGDILIESVLNTDVNIVVTRG